MVCLWWTLRGLSRVSERSLLAGMLAADTLIAGGRRRSRSPLLGALGFGALGFALIAASAVNVVDKTGAFFGAGNSLLVACLCLAAFWLRQPVRHRCHRRGNLHPDLG
jgi:hypothetical protein